MPHRQADPGPAPTVLCSWTKVLVLALRDHGCDADALIASVGLSAGQLAAPDARLPLAATTDLWREGVRALDDESLGLWVPRYSSQTTFHALGYAFMASTHPVGGPAPGGALQRHGVRRRSGGAAV